MYLIVGLGNPEPEYSNTRHNMGFDVINCISKKYKIDVNRIKFNALYGSGEITGEKVILIKPQTFMNLSGQSVREFKKFYKKSFQEYGTKPSYELMCKKFEVRMSSIIGLLGKEEICL